MSESENVTPVQSAPATPGTPGAPLFGRRVDRVPSDRLTMLNRCQCLPVLAKSWSMDEDILPDLPSACKPSVSLLRKCMYKESQCTSWLYSYCEFALKRMKSTVTLDTSSCPLRTRLYSCFSRACNIVFAATSTIELGAEFIGTFMLIFAATATPIVNEKSGGAETLIGLAASSGLAIMIIILSTGHISGAHVNPSITIAFAALRHFPWIQVPLYIGAQVVASICASFALKGIFHPFMHGGVTVPSGSYGQAFSLEFIISFNLMFVVTAVATDTRAVGELAGIAVGATVMLNILIAGVTTGASMNPVRTLGPAIAARNYTALWVYIVAPISGALVGATAYTLVRLRTEDGTHKMAVQRTD
eukprot:Gb_19150 [translate_table: standard]